MSLIKLSHRLEDLKPTAQELDRWRIRTELHMLNSNVNDIVEQRELAMKRMGKLEKDQDLCRSCGKAAASATDRDGMRQCTQCFNRRGVNRLLEQVID